MRTYFALLAVLVSGTSFSQQKDSLRTKTPRFIVKMTHGMTNENKIDFTNSQWEAMTPGYEVPDSLKSVNTSFFGGDVRTFSSNSYYMFTFSLINGKDKQDGRKFQATTTFHLGYGPQISRRKSWIYDQREVIDTLTSNQTGQQYFVYGNRNQTISKEFRSQSIAVGIGQHIATNPNRVFQFETGLDVLCLLGIASEVRASYIDSYSVEGVSYDYGIPYPYPVTQEQRSSSFGGDFAFGLIMRIPLEMSFKLSKNNPVLSRMRLGGELNPGLAMQFAKGQTSNNFSISGGMNFRFAF